MFEVLENVNTDSRHWRVEDCAVFYKTRELHGGLSNMAGGFPLTVNGVAIRTSEALYQACRFPALPEVQRVIIEQASPIAAKMKSKPHRDRTRADWMNLRVDIMYWCLLVKLTQNWQGFGEVLAATGELPIVEKSRKDPFWGAREVDAETLHGANILGQLLMILRRQWKEDSIPEVIEPIGVDNLLLFGRQIEAVVRR